VGYVCTHVPVERSIKYIASCYQRDCLNVAAKQRTRKERERERERERRGELERESSANWTPEMRASFVMQISSGAAAEKRDGDSREKKRGIRVAGFSNLSETPTPL